jgi:general secretion pathway protein C
MRIRLPVSRLLAVALFAALCAIVAGWALQLLAPRAPIAPAGPIAQGQPGLDVALASQLFGGAPRTPAAVQAAAPSNIQVTGVLAAGERGVALLAIDGRPAKPFAVGDTLDGGLKVVSVTVDGVGLARGDQPMRLPAPARGSIDVLTRGPQPGGSAQAPPVPQAAVPGGVQPPPPLRRPLPPAGAAALPQGSPPGGDGPPPTDGQPMAGVVTPGAPPGTGQQ